MKKILFALSSIVATILLTACSNDIDEQSISKAYSFEELTFSVSVNGDCPTRSYENKTEWTAGDIIYVSVDGSNDNVCKLTYAEDGTWNVEQQSENVSFANDKGSLSAVYAEKSTYATDGIETSGDILYTTEGEYTKYGNAVHIGLNMSQRPQSKITIKGVESGYTLTGKYISKITSLKDMSMSKDDGISPYDLTDQTATFFGTIEPNDDNTTTVRLTNSDTNIVYYRTYSKVMTAGDAIVINGPLSSEASEWTKIVGVASVSLSNTELTMLVNDETDITATILPEDATNKNLTWTSSDESVASISSDGGTCHVKALKKGDATITVKTEDGGMTAICTIHVGEISDMVTSTITGASMSSINGYQFISFNLKISNELSSEIVLTKVVLSNSSTGSTLKSYGIDESASTVDAGTSITLSVPINGTYVTGFGFTTTFKYKGESYTTYCTYSTSRY